MKWLTLVCCLIAPVVMAGPVFQDRSDALPSHEYVGGWTHFVGGGIAVFDCNQDDLPDIFAAGGEAPATLIVNEGAFQFRAAEVPPLLDVTGAYPIDLDADGQTDLFVLRAGQNVVLKGLGDCAFEIGSGLLELPASDAWSTAFTTWWDSSDDMPTLAVGNYVDRDDPDGPFGACDHNEVLYPGPNGYSSKRLSPGFCALSILAAEDARGRMALRLSNDRHYYVKGGYEQMWDIAEARFLTAEDGWQKVALWGMGIASRDLTGDGRDEVMLTSMGDQLLQIAQANGTYRAAPYSIGTYAQRPHTGGDGRPSTGWHAEFADVDNDGLADLFIAKGNVDQMPGMATRDPNNLLMQTADGTFVETAAEAGVAGMARSRGAALADFDLDGRLDLIVSNRRAPLELYQNVTSDTGNWVRVALSQPGKNLNAIGARLTVTAGPRRQTVQRTVGGGHAGGQLLPLHFGLGEATRAEVVVTWPDGEISQHSVIAGELATIRKPPHG